MLQFKTGKSSFLVRVSALLVDGDRVLIRRRRELDYYGLPSAPLEQGSSSEEGALRLILDEFGALARISRLLWIGEQFFDFDGRRRHELGFYYLLDSDDPDLYDRGDRFAAERRGAWYEYRWVRRARLREYMFFPLHVKERITALPATVEHFVCHEAGRVAPAGVGAAFTGE